MYIYPHTSISFSSSSSSDYPLCLIEMKFWKILRKLLDEIFPDWQDKFISYKDLKQQLKLISPLTESSGNLVDNDNERSKKRPRFCDEGDEGKEVTKEMKDFVMLLEGEIKKFNGFFMDKEEEYIIRFKVWIYSLFELFILALFILCSCNFPFGVKVMWLSSLF